MKYYWIKSQTYVNPLLWDDKKECIKSRAFTRYRTTDIDMKKDLVKLKAEGIIEREGPDKGGSWKVK